MRSPHLPAVLSGLLALAVVGVAGPPAAASDDVVDMRYEGYGPAGLHMVTTHTAVEETGGGYQIRGDVETAGLAGVFVSLQNKSTARGRLAGDAVQPEAFDSETARNGIIQKNRVAFRGDDIPDGSSTPPPAEPVTPLDRGRLRGTVDNLTAYFLVQRQLGRGGNCAMTVPVFDGRHRYDLRFSDAGDQVLAPSSGQNFSGTARTCRMVRDEIGGFYVDRGHREGAHAGTFWYARLLNGDIAVPVRMQLDTEIGGLDFYLAELKGRGINLRFME